MASVYQNSIVLTGADGSAGDLLGYVDGDSASIAWDDTEVLDSIRRVSAPGVVVSGEGKFGLAALGGGVLSGEEGGGVPAVGYLPSCALTSLGDPAFRAAHGLRFAYCSGAMANGIGSVAIVQAMGAVGMLGFFGAAGLSLGEVEAAINQLQETGEAYPYGFNLIHSPNESDLEEAVVDLYLRKGVRLIEASAYLALTPAVVRYRVAGIHADAAGGVVTPNKIVAKISRVEVAEQFLSPPPAKMLGALVADGVITEEQAGLAARIPMAEDITAEADSGGHTDRRPAIALLPTIMALRDRMQEEFGYATRPRVGLAGGISTPASAAGAFAMGAAYVVVGSVNQSCVESGSSDTVREMLAEARQADIAMAPAADMFEMGVEVQVLKRGTMFAMRGAKLYELYRGYDSLDAIPEVERVKLEKTIFHAPLATVWAETAAFFQERDPAQVVRAEADPKHKMALLFRWYLGQSSRWANRGVSERKVDYQVWCGPAMGAFNEWARGTFLESPAAREVALVAMNILYGAAVLARCQSLRQQGFPVPLGAERIVPQRVEDLREYF